MAADAIATIAQRGGRPGLLIEGMPGTSIGAPVSGQLHTVLFRLVDSPGAATVFALETLLTATRAAVPATMAIGVSVESRDAARWVWLMPDAPEDVGRLLHELTRPADHPVADVQVVAARRLRGRRGRRAASGGCGEAGGSRAPADFERHVDDHVRGAGPRRWQLAGRAVGIATSYDDRAFVDGRARYEHDILQRPAHAAVWLLRRARRSGWGPI